LKKLTEVFGVDWSKESIIPKVIAMGQHPNYLYRMTTCFAVSVSLPMFRLRSIHSNDIRRSPPLLHSISSKAPLFPSWTAW
jgi:hypothetical protein